MDKSFIHKLYLSHQDCPTCPTPTQVSEFFIRLLGMLFPDFAQLSLLTEAEFEQHILKLKIELEGILKYSLTKGSDNAATITTQFFNGLPDIFTKLQQDVEAMYSGDPAAKTKSEVIRTYPGFYAIAAYRIANQLHMKGVKGVPRVITEHAHSKTGIDIHPAAKIGEHFCIDHGTGVVIGETSEIGNHVKLYQGVTLGALSVDKGDAEKKRHPTIMNNVIVYAGATILGGETIIGSHSIVGGNVWLTRSVPPHSRIYYQSKMYHGDANETDMVIFKQHK